jgi:ABC-type multidrug transport system permease subunit
MGTKRGGSMLAYDFPLLSMFWVLLWGFFLFSIFFAVVWAFVDNFRRADHSGWAKAGWALFILVVPLFGVLIYLIARPAEVAPA